MQMAQVVAEDTAIQQDSDEEVVVDHDLERQNLIGQVKTRAKKPGCRNMACKAFVLSLSGILFLLMMIQLWSDYGEYIQTQTFPPKIVSMGSYCKNSTEQERYKALECVYDTALKCKISKPSKPFVFATPPSVISWESDALLVTPESVTECVDLIVWSI